MLTWSLDRQIFTYIERTLSCPIDNVNGRFGQLLKVLILNMQLTDDLMQTNTEGQLPQPFF